MPHYKFERDPDHPPEKIAAAPGNFLAISGRKVEIGEDGVDYTVLHYIRSNAPKSDEVFRRFVANEPAGAIEMVRQAHEAGEKGAVSQAIKRELVHRAIFLAMQAGSDHALPQAVAAMYEEITYDQD